MQNEFDEKSIMIIIRTFAYLYCCDLCCYRSLTSKIFCIVEFIEMIWDIRFWKNHMRQNIVNCKMELHGYCWKWIPLLLYMKGKRIQCFKMRKAAELTKQKLHLIIKYLWNLPESGNLNHSAWKK